MLRDNHRGGWVPHYLCFIPKRHQDSGVLHRGQNRAHNTENGAILGLVQSSVFTTGLSHCLYPHVAFVFEVPRALQLIHKWSEHKVVQRAADSSLWDT